MFAAARDVTERQHFERTLQETNAALEFAKATAETIAALHAAALGLQVTGYDRDLSPDTARMLTAAGVKISGEDDLDILA